VRYGCSERQAARMPAGYYVDPQKGSKTLKKDKKHCATLTKSYGAMPLYRLCRPLNFEPSFSTPRDTEAQQNKTIYAAPLRMCAHINHTIHSLEAATGPHRIPGLTVDRFPSARPPIFHALNQPIFHAPKAGSLAFS